MGVGDEVAKILRSVAKVGNLSVRSKQPNRYVAVTERVSLFKVNRVAFYTPACSRLSQVYKMATVVARVLSQMTR